VAQKKVIRKTIRDDDIVRQKLRQKSAKSRPPGLSRSVILAEEGSEGEDSAEAIADATQSTASVFLDHTDTEFPIAPFKTVSDPTNDLSPSRNAARRAPQPNSMSSVAEESEVGAGDKGLYFQHICFCFAF
jgi:hypothetical protein